MALTRPRIAQFDTTVSSLSDPITVLHGGSTLANVDIGFLMNRANGLVPNVALYWNEAGNTFVTAFTGNTGVTDTNIAVTSYANITTGSITVNGAILPAANVSYDLGSPTQRFRTLYISGNTIDIGGALISSDSAGVTITHNSGSQFSLAAAGETPTTSNATGAFGNVILSSDIASTSTLTGALQVTGGVGITGNLFAGGNLTLAGGVGSSISVPYETVSAGVGYSYYFNGSSGLRYPTTSELEFGSGDFTIEFWMNAGSSQTPYATLTDSSTNNQATAIGVANNNGGTPGKLSFQAAGSSGTVTGSTSILDNTWHHIACVKSGSNGYVFVDGQLDGSTSSWSGVTNAYLSGGTLGRSNYGGGGGGDNTYAGYLSNFRIIKGTALYTSNFTVPTVPLSAVANTQLLTLQDATVIDNSTNAFTFSSAGSSPTAGTTPTLEASGGSTTTAVASLTLNSDGAWESSTDLVVPGAIYTDNYKFANGAAYITTSIANTSDIVANASSGIVGVSLTNTGVSAGTYGNATSIPTVTVDSKGRISSIANNAVSTKINLSSGAEEGSGNTAYSYYVTNGSAVAPSAAMATIGTNDFTMELFFRIGSYRYNGRIVGLGGYAQGGNFNIETASGILIHINGSFSSYSATLDPGTWYHLAVSRTSGVVTVFLNGTSIGSHTQSGPINNSSNFYMGSTPSGDYFDGYLNNVRVVNGTGLYTSDFTPPTTNLTAVSGTQLLTLQDATLIDRSTNAYSITTQGTAPVVSDSITPFSSGGGASTANVAGGGTLTISGVGGVTSSVTNATYTIGLGTLPGFVSSGVANIANTTASSSTTTGALIVAGGAGIGGNLYVAGNLTATGHIGVHYGSATLSTISTSSTIISAGNIVAGSGTSSTSITTGAMVVAGGIGVSGNIYVDKVYTTNGLYWAGNGYVLSSGGGSSAVGSTGQMQYNNAGVLAAASLIAYSGNNAIVANAGLTSTSTTSGSFQVKGGAGITGNLYVGGDVVTSGNIVTTGNVINVTITGNSGQFFGNAAGFNSLYMGIPSGYFIEPQMVAEVASNFNGFAGFNMQNINSGSLASTDLFLTPDNGTASDTFLDIGIASSTYNYPGYTLIKPNDAYLFNWGNAITGGGNLILGTGYTNDIVFAVQGINTNNEVMRITRANIVAIKGNVAVTNTIYGQGIYDNGNRVLTSLSSTGAGNLTVSVSAPASTTIALPATGPGATTVGSSTSIPVITTDAYGRISALTSQAVSTTISLAGTTGTGSVAGGGTLTFAGSNGVTATVSSSTITVGIPQAISTSSTPTFGGATINGTVTATTINATTINPGTINAGTINAATIGNASAVLYGTLNSSSASQTNITTLGNLTSLSVAGTSSRGGKAMITNYTGATAPGNPQQGDEWWYTTGNILYKYINDGTTSSWINVTSSLYNASASATASTLALRDTGGNLTATNFIGIASSAKYADLAEIYIPDQDYAPGTVVIFGGDNEIATTDQSHDSRVAGVISTNPAYLMNSECNGLPVAFTGRVPCLVQGPVKKGELLVTSNKPGVAQAIDNTQFVPGCVIGKSLENITTKEITTIEVVVGRF